MYLLTSEFSSIILFDHGVSWFPLELVEQIEDRMSSLTGVSVASIYEGMISQALPVCQAKH